MLYFNTSTVLKQQKKLLGAKMASLSGCGCTAWSPPSQPISRFHHRNCIPQTPPKLILNLSPNPLTFRIKSALRCQMAQRQFVAYASNSDPSSGDSVEEKSGGKASDAPQGPPFLTILAGLLVFFVVSWVIGSIIIWLISLIANLPPSK